MHPPAGDHGPINTWDRQPFYSDLRGPAGSWNPLFSTISRNVIIATYGSSQGVDNDDGSTWFDLHHNVVYGEGIKQDYGGHDSKYHSNLNLVHKYDGQNCFNTAPFKDAKGPCGDWSPGPAVCSHAHRFENNTCIVLYEDIVSPNAGGCPPDLDQMVRL